MELAVYNASTNKVRTFIREDHGGYTPPSGYTLVATGDLPQGWTYEEDNSAALFLAALRAEAKLRLDQQQANEALLRGTILVLIDEINLLRQWITSFKTATAGAATLAAFKTAVAALDNMPHRTGEQARTAIGNKIDAGDADE